MIIGQAPVAKASVPLARAVSQTVFSVLVAESRGPQIISRGWGSCVWPDTHLTYMINIALTTEFALTVGGAR
jgi:hypothetical protein